MAKVLLPNSESEMNRVIRDFPDAAENRWVTVPNAVESYEFDSVPEAPLPHRAGSRDIVLCVAYIGYRKNQLRLVRALSGSDLPLVIIGGPTPNAKHYFKQIESEAGKNVHILGRIDDEKVIRQWYRAAKVHVLASWMETTGLSSLEAGLGGCNLVITDRGDTREYFGDMAYYCDPGSEASIREAVLKAYSAPVCTALQHRIRTEFNWTKTAEATIKGYRQIYNGND
jgi:glycosyltransferase involved in cell wall biosynthesis